MNYKGWGVDKELQDRSFGDIPAPRKVLKSLEAVSPLPPPSYGA